MIRVLDALRPRADAPAGDAAYRFDLDDGRALVGEQLARVLTSGVVGDLDDHQSVEDQFHQITPASVS